MFSSTINNSTLTLTRSNPLNPSSTTNLPRISGPRPYQHQHQHPPTEQGNAKRFKPNVESCRAREFPESVKEYIAGEGCCPQAAPCHCVFAEGGQPEGIGVVEEGDPEEGAPVRVSTNKQFLNQKFVEASSNASTLTSPMASSIESSETITEFDLAQDACEPTKPSDLKKLLKTLEHQKGLICTAINQSSTDSLLTFKCPGEHTFTISSSEKIVCSKCELLLSKCRQYAKQNNGNLIINALGKLVTKKYEGYIEFECEKGHVWRGKGRYALCRRSLFSGWCEECARRRKLERKKRRKQEEQRRYYEKFGQEQNELLENARLQMLQQTSCNPLLNQIDELARQMSTNYLYCSSNESLKVSSEDITFLYKILATPQELLIQTM